LSQPSHNYLLELISSLGRRTVELVQPRRRIARTDDVRNVIKVMQNSPTAAYLRECSLHERMMLAALLKCIKREGVEEIKWGEVRASFLTRCTTLVLIDATGETSTSCIYECAARTG
jgi:Cdc6-like AAA superfamily ATPase